MAVLAAVGALVAVMAGTAAAELTPVGDRVQVSNRADELYYDANPIVRFSAAATGGGHTLVVWEDNRGRVQIYGQFLTASGTPVGPDFQISDMPSPDEGRKAAVAYDAAANEFLVVWEGKDDIWGQRVKFGAVNGAPGGEQIGADFQISNATPSKNDFVGQADLAFDPTMDNDRGGFLVVWQDLRVGDFVIWGQRVLSGGAAAGEDFAISKAREARADADAQVPAIDYNAKTDDFLTVWVDSRADRKRTGGGGTLYELYGQRTASDGAAIGSNFLLDAPSPAGQEDKVGPIANTALPRSIDVAADPVNGYYLAVMSTNFQAKDGTELVKDVHGILVSPTGAMRPTTVSDLNRAPSDDYAQDAASSVRLSYSPAGRQWLAVWHSAQGDPKAFQHETLNENRYEIFGQTLDIVGEPEKPCSRPMTEPCEKNDTLEVGEDFQISHTSDTGTYANRDATYPAVAYQPDGDTFAVTWEADGHSQPYTKPKSGQEAQVTDDWLEIYLQHLKGPSPRDVTRPGGGGPAGGGPAGGGAAGGGAVEKLRALLLKTLAQMLADQKGTGVGVPVSCPAGRPGATCNGSITGTTVDKFPPGARLAATRARPAVIRLGTARFRVPQGTTAQVRVPLGKAAAAQLRKRGKLRVRLVIDSGELGQTTQVVTIFAPTPTVAATRAGVVKVRIAVPATAKSGAPTTVSLRRGRKDVAKATTRAKPGTTAVVTLRLGAADRRTLLAKRRLALTLVVVATNAAGKHLTDQRPVAIIVR